MGSNRKPSAGRSSPPVRRLSPPSVRSVFLQEVGLALNRANPTILIGRALVPVLLLSLAAWPAAAQNRTRDPKKGGGFFGNTGGGGRGSHEPYGPKLDRIPSSMTRREFDPKLHRAPGDQNVTRQTVLLTKRVSDSRFSVEPAEALSLHPFWTADERYIYFDSNRVSDQDSRKRNDGIFNLFRMFPDGSGLTQVTTGGDNQLEPALSVDGRRLAFVSGGTLDFTKGTLGNPPTSGFSLFYIDYNDPQQKITPVTSNQNIYRFSDVRHPSWSGNTIAFAGQLGAGTPYHIFTADVITGTITQWTAGPSNDYSPAFSPGDGLVIAFTSNAAAFGPTAVPITASGMKQNDDIWIISRNTIKPNPKQVTAFAVGGVPASNKNPAWSTLRPDPLNIVGGELPLLAFASNRADSTGNGIPDRIVNTLDIYWLHAAIVPDRDAPGAYKIATPESAGNPALKLRTSTPDTAIDQTEPTFRFDPNFTSDEDYPAWPQYVSSYRMAFQSTRGNGALAPHLDLWAATIFDINAPSLLKYDIPNNEIVHVARDSAPDVSVREVAAGEKVRFRVRVVDYETGVESVFLQIKNPSSWAQDSRGIEHKTFYDGPGVIDPNKFVVQSPFEMDCQAINPTTYGYRPKGYTGPTWAGLNDPAWPGWNTYVAGFDDNLAFSGSQRPPDTDFWLRLWDDGPIDKGGHEPLGEKAGDGVYTASWVTSTEQSDWYLDVIVRDRATNPFKPRESTNWKIYDNVWGFTTKPFVPASGILYVNDYDIGQRFFQTRFGSGVGFNLGGSIFSKTFNGFPTESWMTEYDWKLFPTRWAQPPNGGSLVISGGANTFQNALGEYSYGMLPIGNPYYDPLVHDGTRIPVTQRYDQWRILSRGPVPPSIFNFYGGHPEVQIPDVLGTRPATTVTVAERMVIWHSPYSGDLFVGPGTILDQSTQDSLENFVKNGGRLFVTGNDIAWALTLLSQSGSANRFLNTILKARYVLDFPPGGLASQAINLTGGAYTHPISTQYWFLSNPNLVHSFPGANPYDPPSSGQIYIGPTTPNPPNRWYMCEGASNLYGYPDVVDFIPPNPIPAGSAGDVDGNWTTVPNPNIFWYMDGTNAAQGRTSKIVFSSFGWEGINPEYFQTDTVVNLKNRRTEMIHNVGDYLRTGRLIGAVRDVEGAAPLGGVFIRAVNVRTNLTNATTLSLGDGSYVMNGLEADGAYRIEALKAGFQIQKLQATVFHGGYQGRVDFFLSKALPGSISGKVTTPGGDPVPGAVVQATDISNPTDNSPPVFRATTLADGTYTIRSVPASKYRVVVVNVADLGYAGSTPDKYEFTLNAREDRQNVDFQLKAQPGRILGKVTRQDGNGNDTGIGISGATVTAVSGNVTFTAVTDQKGNYTMANVDQGSYGVVAVALGFKPSPSITVRVVSKQDTININFALAPIPPGSFSGLVRSSNDQAVSGATVTLTDAAGSPVRDQNGNVLTGTTGPEQNVNGYRFNYRVNNVPAGAQVTVTVSKPGYNAPKPANRQVSVDSQKETQGVDFVLDPLHIFPRQLSLVSSPYEYTKSVADLFDVPAGDRTSGVFQFVSWDGSKYIPFPNPPADTFHLGMGYFMGSSNPAQTFALIEQGRATDPARPFEIALKAGWNLIGDPFTFPINFLNLKIREANGTIVDIPTAQGGSNPALGAALWTYENAGGYQVAYTIDTWRGYFLRAFRPITLIVDPAARQDRHRAPSFDNVNGDGWKLDLVASAGGVRSHQSFLGVTGAATAGYDRFKLEAPPAIGSQNVSLTFDHNDWGDRSGRYAMDVRARATTTQSWDFTVTSNVPGTPVTVAWPALATVPGKQDLMLTDLDTQQKIDLRTRSQYVIPAANGGITRHFRLEVRPPGRVALSVRDLAVRMNGGGPGRAATSVGINYTLTADATVQVNVFQNGRIIRTVDPGRHRAAGSSEALWDLKNDQGVSVAANTYQVEVRASDSEGHTTRSVTSLLVTR